SPITLFRAEKNISTLHLFPYFLSLIHDSIPILLISLTTFLYGECDRDLALLRGRITASTPLFCKYMKLFLLSYPLSAYC
ncbi:MAG: hypothetical protein QXP36_13190, partial [Conexivisphaerales archaeon]